MTRQCVLLLDNIHPAAERSFAAADMDVVRHAALGDVPERELGAATLLGIRSKTAVDDALLRRMPRLLALGVFGVGTDRLDLDLLSGRGIALFNAPYSNTRSVVELALGQMLALLRHSGDRNREMHDGTWNKVGGGQEARGRTHRHNRLRQCGVAAVGALRGSGDEGVVLRPDGEAGAGQRHQGRQHGAGSAAGGHTEPAQ